MAGTFQNRLVTELRLAKAETMEDANEVLHRCLSRFDGQFGVLAAQPQAAYRTPPPAAAVEQALCLRFHRKVARDNTVRHEWRTLQLLPGVGRTSYAGAQVEVLERPDGRLLVECRGHLVQAQEAPPRPGLLRVLGNRPTSHGRANGSSHGHHELASLEKTDVDSEQAVTPRRKRKRATPGPRKPTPRQKARWQAVQEARARGLSLRAIARELGIHRQTARKYALAKSPPVQARANPATPLSDIIYGQDGGQFR